MLSNRCNKLIHVSVKKYIKVRICFHNENFIITIENHVPQKSEKNCSKIGPSIESNSFDIKNILHLKNV